MKGRLSRKLGKRQLDVSLDQVTNTELLTAIEDATVDFKKETDINTLIEAHTAVTSKQTASQVNALIDDHENVRTAQELNTYINDQLNTNSLVTGKQNQLTFQKATLGSGVGDLEFDDATSTFDYTPPSFDGLQTTLGVTTLGPSSSYPGGYLEKAIDQVSAAEELRFTPVNTSSFASATFAASITQTVGTKADSVETANALNAKANLSGADFTNNVTITTPSGTVAVLDLTTGYVNGGTAGNQSRINFAYAYPDQQDVQIRHNTFNSERTPFGLHIERGVTNNETWNDPYLFVEGHFYHHGISNLSDDRVKSYETDLSDATATLRRLTPKRYEKHVNHVLTEAEEAPDLTGVSHFTEVGFIAQEVEQIPELEFMVDTAPNGIKALQMNNLLGYLVKGFQEMDARLTDLHARLAVLEGG